MRKVDLIIAIAAVILLGSLGFVLFRGDQVGVSVEQTFPMQDVPLSQYGRVGITFAEPMRRTADVNGFSITPEVTGRTHWEGNTLWFTPDEPFDPDTEYTAALEPGLVADSGREVVNAISWSFPIRAPYVAYVKSPNAEREIWRTRADGVGLPRQITFSGGLVFDFDVAPDGTRIAYSQRNDSIGFDLWLWVEGTVEGEPTILLDCGEDRCSEPTFSPDGTKVAYSRENAPPQPGQNFAPPRVWVLDLVTGDNNPLYNDKQILGFTPRWSPDQQYLAIFDSNGNQVRVYHFESDSDFAYNSWLGTTGFWLPNNRHMIYNNIDLETEGQPQRVYLADIENQTVTALTDSEDAYKVSSTTVPNPVTGDLLVGVRPVGFKPGSQLWLFPANGDLPIDITSNNGFTYSNPRWHPDGTQFLVQEIALEEAYATPNVMLMNLETGEQTLIVEDAAQAHWMP